MYTKSLDCRLSILHLSLQVQFPSPLIIPVLFLQALSPPGPHFIYLNCGVPKPAPDDEQVDFMHHTALGCTTHTTTAQCWVTAHPSSCAPVCRAATWHVHSWSSLSVFRSLFVPLLNYILTCPLCHHQFEFWSCLLTSLRPISALCCLQI